MSLHNALNRGDLSSALLRALGNTRGAEGLERIGETLTPIIHLWGLPEWAYLRHERLAASATFGAAVVAEFAAVGVLNPVGSGMLVVVEAISVSNGAAAGQYLIKQATSAVVLATLAVTTTGFVRDRRWMDSASFLPRAQSLTGTDVAAIVGTTHEEMRVGANVSAPAVVCVPIVIPPGHAVIVNNTATNVGFTASIAWRERQAYPSELV